MATLLKLGEFLGRFVWKDAQGVGDFLGRGGLAS